MQSWIVASAGGTTLPSWPPKDSEADFSVWPVMGIIVLVVVIGLIYARKR